MNPTTAVRSDVLPAVGSFLIPGTVAATPWVALAWGAPHHLQKFVDANEAISSAVGALLIVGVGLLIESVGTFVESQVVDRESRNPDVSERWYEYLKIAWIREPIGQRYLRKILMTFKFELNLLVATIPTMLGTLALHHYHVIRDEDTAWLALSIALLGCYLWHAVVADADLLHRLRGTLLEVAEEQAAEAADRMASSLLPSTSTSRSVTLPPTS